MPLGAADVETAVQTYIADAGLAGRFEQLTAATRTDGQTVTVTLTARVTLPFDALSLAPGAPPSRSPPPPARPTCPDRTRRHRPDGDLTGQRPAASGHPTSNVDAMHERGTQSAHTQQPAKDVKAMAPSLRQQPRRRLALRATAPQ